MKTLNRSLVVVSMVMCLIVSAYSQAAMTNNDVVALTKAGLSTAAIVNKIRSSKGNFDLSTTALIELKKVGVGDAVIEAMQEGSRAYSETKDPGPIAPSTVTPQLIGEWDAALKQVQEPGIYVYENGQMKEIEPTVFSGTKANFLGSALTYGIKKAKVRAKVRGKAANMQVGADLPIFFFVFNPEYKNSGATMAGGWWGLPATSPAEFVLVQMDVKDTSREAVMGEFGAFSGMSTGARDKDVREYAFEKLRPGIYKVVPKANLSTGQYCFYYAAEVGGLGIGGGKIFDFGISK